MQLPDYLPIYLAKFFHFEVLENIEIQNVKFCQFEILANVEIQNIKFYNFENISASLFINL